MSFRAHLEAKSFPPRLGDARLWLDEGWLFIEEVKGAPSFLPTVWLAASSASAVVAAAVLLTRAADTGVGWAAALTGLSICFAVVASRHHHRARRRVAMNFETHRVRVDTPSPFRGLPNTLWVSFEEVRGFLLLPTQHGRHALAMDFTAPGDTVRVLREVLVADLLPSQLEAAERLGRLLHDAAGLTPA